MRKTFFIVLLCAIQMLLAQSEKEKAEPCVKLIKPAQNQMLCLLQEEHRQFWNTEEERSQLEYKKWKEAKAIVEAKKDNCRPAPVTFQWECSKPAKEFILVLSGDGEVRRIRIEKENKVSVDNLRIGTKYIWYVDARLEDGAIERSEGGQFKTDDLPPRWINLPGISNVRDVGGWKTADGTKRIRQGMIYRGSHLDIFFTKAAQPNKAVIRDILRIRTDWDLRGIKESAKGMRSYPLEDLNVRLYHYPKKSRTPQGLAQEMHFLANNVEFPVYIHCHGGADRTGEIVFILEALLGLKDQDLLTDYEMTSFGCWGKRSRHNGLKALLTMLDKYGEAQDPYAKKVEAFLKEGGLSQFDIDTLRSRLLESL